EALHTSHIGALTASDKPKDGSVMTKPTRPWLPMLALCVWAGGSLLANEDPHKKEEAKPAQKKAEAPKQEAKEAKKEEPKPVPAPPPAAKPPAAKPAPVRAASMRRPPVRRPAVTRRTTAPITVTASPESAAPPAPSTAVIHLVTHSADGPGASGFPVPDEIAKMIESRDKAERDRMDWARVERERQAMEQSLAERERALAAREAALRRPEPQPEPQPQPVVRKRVDKNLLTNEGLVKLADAGYDETFLLELIRRRPSKFDTTVEGLSYLMQAGLTQQLVRTVLAVDEWERARRAEALAGASAATTVAGGQPPSPPATIPAGMKEIHQKVMVPQGQLRAGERGVMMLEPSGERWYWVPDGSANR
ncbi:MAG: hypothetical protein ABI972_08920, partial [Acidobacteriota bacterium]